METSLPLLYLPCRTTNTSSATYQTQKEEFQINPKTAFGEQLSLASSTLSSSVSFIAY